MPESILLVYSWGSVMNEREQRGLVIAALCKLNRQNDEAWLVPSQSGGDRAYTVNVKTQTCTCPDHQEGGHKCKHLFAVEITMKRECRADGTVIETRSVTFTEKKTYKQDWPAYNEAQTTEKHRFQTLLAELARSVPTPQREEGKAGRPRTPVSDQVFGVALKIYSTLSTRRFACDLKDAYERGYVSRPIHYNVVNSAMESESLTPVLQTLITRSAIPLTPVESTFAVDSSGFTSSKFVRWYDEKYGITRRQHDWVKVHLCCGTQTNVVTAARVLEQNSADCPQFAPLVKETSEHFRIGEVSGDKAYCSWENYEVVNAMGGTAYLAFKENMTGAAGGTFGKMFHYYQFNAETFMDHYHRRSNAESTFSAIKRKFGDHVRSRTPVSMVNEVLGKILAHNICCVIASQCELGIEPVFWPNEMKSVTMK